MQIHEPVSPDGEPQEPHPIHLVVTDDLRRSRLTVFLRALLVIPHLIWLSLWGIAVYFAILAAWFAALVTGRVPGGLHGFIAAYARYQTHVYSYWSLAANPFPGFTGAPGYPIDLVVAAPEKQSRLTVFFRILLAIPAFIFLYVLQIVGYTVAFLSWFFALFTGRLNKGMRDVLAYCIRYNAQVFGYVGLLTQRYPSFSDD